MGNTVFPNTGNSLLFCNRVSLGRVGSGKTVYRAGFLTGQESNYSFAALFQKKKRDVMKSDGPSDVCAVSPHDR